MEVSGDISGRMASESFGDKFNLLPATWSEFEVSTAPLAIAVSVVISRAELGLLGSVSHLGRWSVYRGRPHDIDVSPVQLTGVGAITFTAIVSLTAAGFEWLGRPVSSGSWPS